MLDQYGRSITYLRISITDRCNLRCKYCMPDGVTDVGMKNILTFEEIWEIVRAGVSLGITHVRITGGEPLVRKGCVDLIRGIRAIPGVETITMTTNGVLLRTYAASLKEAGLDGLNVSLDTLDFEEFASLAGRQNLKEVLDTGGKRNGAACENQCSQSKRAKSYFSCFVCTAGKNTASFY